MVLFQNIHVNQNIEVLLNGRIVRGTVKFKGCLNGIDGDWVGVALKKPYGTHDGMLYGRRYFQCMTNHGIFVTANKIRFVPTTKRCLYNNYKTVEQDPIGLVDFELFSDENREDLLLDMDDYELSRSSRSSSRFSHSRARTPPPFPPSHSFHLPHRVGRTIPAATMMSPETARRPYSTYRTLPIHSEYYDDERESFISTPSIPKTHMPHTALSRQVARGWETVPYAREMSVNTGRDSIQYDTWNYLY